MSKFSRRTKIIAGFVLILVVGFGIVEFFNAENNGVPQDFTDARQQGALISENIVNLSGQSTSELAQVNQLDAQGNYSQALTITTNLINESEQLRNQAVSLSGQVEQMTKSLSNINSFPAQQAALEAISSQLALINQLVNYSADLSNLFDALQNRFEGHSETNAQIQSFVNQINTDVNAINNFNAQATQAMSQFDTIEGK